MNKHNKSLGNSSTKGPALNTGTNKIIKATTNLSPKIRKLNDRFLEFRNGGLPEMKKRLDGLLAYLNDPSKQASARVREFVHGAVEQYELALKASVGMPTYTDCVTLQSQAPVDIPTLPLDGFQLLQRTVPVSKLANLGTTAGGFYAELLPADIAQFVGSSFFRVKNVTSWTVPRADGSLTQGTFAGVQIPAGGESGGTENLPIWSENWQPVGQGFAGITTQYPLGDFPQYASSATTFITRHYTALGGVGGVTNVPVVFHATIEYLL